MSTPTVRKIQDRKFVPNGVRMVPTVEVRSKVTGKVMIIALRDFDSKKHEKTGTDTKALQAEVSTLPSKADRIAARQRSAVAPASETKVADLKLMTEEQLKLLPEWEVVPRKRQRAAASKDDVIELILQARRGFDEESGSEE